MRQRVLCTLSVAYKGIAISSERKFSHLELKKICCSFHDEESQFRAVHQLSDGRHQDDEEEELTVVVAGKNISIQFLNQFDENPFHGLRIVGLDVVELDLEDEFLCYHILQMLHLLCAACHKPSLLLRSHRADPLVHLHLQSSTRASTSFRCPSCRNVRMVL